MLWFDQSSLRLVVQGYTSRVQSWKEKNAYAIVYLIERPILKSLWIAIIFSLGIKSFVVITVYVTSGKLIETVNYGEFLRIDKLLCIRFEIHGQQGAARFIRRKNLLGLLETVQERQQAREQVRFELAASCDLALNSNCHSRGRHLLVFKRSLSALNLDTNESEFLTLLKIDKPRVLS